MIIIIMLILMGPDEVGRYCGLSGILGPEKTLWEVQRCHCLKAGIEKC